MLNIDLCMNWPTTKARGASGLDTTKSIESDDTVALTAGLAAIDSYVVVSEASAIRTRESDVLTTRTKGPQLCSCISTPAMREYRDT